MGERQKISASSAYRKCIPTLINVGLVLLVVALQFYLFFGAPWLIKRFGSDLAWTLIPAVLVTPTLWALIHEAIHGLLMPTRVGNETAGRLLAVLFGTSFSLLQFGHLYHHLINRTGHAQGELYVPGTWSGYLARLSYYPRLLGGFYVAELLTNIVIFLPMRWLRALSDRMVLARGGANIPALIKLKSHLLQPRRVWLARMDAAMVVLVLLLAWRLYGEYAWILGVALVFRALFVSLNDNAYHYGTAIGNNGEALDVALPAWVRYWLLNGNYHRTHHRSPSVPWFALSDAAEIPPTKRGIGFMFEQLRGPIPVKPNHQ
ncbi:MAG: fatty acid desaturase [Pseudomonadota bacterium]|nr:fatty acid desaturase [Pseudomonadota bacterium]